MAAAAPRLSPAPVTPPYLVDPPAVIPIDVGRQLFVDDFLIEETSLTRTFHRAEYHPANPVLSPETQWEKYDEYAERTKTRSNPAAMVFSDGVFFDPADRLFKMWYMGGYDQNTCFAMSHDGIAWDSRARRRRRHQHRHAWPPRFEHGLARSRRAAIGRARYKMARWYDHDLELLASPDGIHWRDDRPDRRHRRSLDVLLQPVPPGLGLQPARRDRTAGGLATLSPVLGNAGSVRQRELADATSRCWWTGADSADPRAA